MLKKYEKFIKEFDKKIRKYFEVQSEHICCKEGCAACCEVGDYPFSQLEMMYLMSGFQKLPDNIKIQIKNKSYILINTTKSEDIKDPEHNIDIYIGYLIDAPKKDLSDSKYGYSYRSILNTYYKD